MLGNWLASGPGGLKNSFHNFSISDRVFFGMFVKRKERLCLLGTRQPSSTKTHFRYNSIAKQANTIWVAMMRALFPTLGTRASCACLKSSAATKTLRASLAGIFGGIPLPLPLLFRLALPPHDLRIRYGKNLLHRGTHFLQRLCRIVNAVGWVASHVESVAESERGCNRERAFDRSDFMPLSQSR